MLKSFDERRQDLKPYGLTCEVWRPHIMRRPDRHNEIEINFLTGSSITYLFYDRKIKVDKDSIVVFWALLSHQIVDYDNKNPYYVLTIPFSIFSQWRLRKSFKDSLLEGNIQIINVNNFINECEFHFSRWNKDLDSGGEEITEICMLEIQAFLRRLDLSEHDNYDFKQIPMNLVEQMAVFIAKNYRNGISVSDVTKAVNLHPDYANAIFKKTFNSTISRYLTEQKILFAKRELIVTKKSITSIAYASGFNSISRFNSAFLKFSSQTPREYRKLHLKNS